MCRFRVVFIKQAYSSRAQNFLIFDRHVHEWYNKKKMKIPVMFRINNLFYREIQGYKFVDFA